VISRVGTQVPQEEVPALLRGKDVHDIEELKRQGLSIKAISKVTGFDRKTIRKYLSQSEAAPVYGPREPGSKWSRTAETSEMQAVTLHEVGFVRSAGEADATKKRVDGR
jgi:transposase